MPNDQTLERWWDDLCRAIDTQNTDAFVDFLTADAEFRFGNAEPAAGSAAIRDAVDGFFATIERSEHALSRTWNDGDSRVCEGRVTYTRLDGSRVGLPFVNVFEMRGDKIARYSIYIDIAPLYAPAGAST